MIASVQVGFLIVNRPNPQLAGNKQRNQKAKEEEEGTRQNWD